MPHFLIKYAACKLSSAKFKRGCWVRPYSKEYGRAIKHKTAYTYNQSYMHPQSYIPLCGI
jgi:hypothetical protein